MSKVRFLLAGTMLIAAAVSVAWATGVFRHENPAAGDPTATDSPATDPSAMGPLGQMVSLPGGTFRMGNDVSSHADQRPAHEVAVSPFSIDEHEVTNRQFARFVAETSCRTTAEQRGWSYVYDRKRQTWVKRAGADWRHPGGPDSSWIGREDYPVVHVSWHDATAYARWAGKQLPTEAQWEYAARSGLRDADFPWGDEELVDGRYRANYRQHGKDPAADGYAFAAPVRSYPPSRFGLYDMSGNVWEWCADWYDEDYYSRGAHKDPTGPAEGTMRVHRGGSWLSPEHFRFDHHVSTRAKHTPETTYEHGGFRCVAPPGPHGDSVGVVEELPSDVEAAYLCGVSRRTWRRSVIGPLRRSLR